MPDWNKLSDKGEQARAAAFEARLLAELKQTAPKPPVVPAAPASRPVGDGIEISLTAHGQTTRYDKLENVPEPLRQRIMSAWLGAPPPVGLPAPRRRSRGTAVGLNLLLPGAGQFYSGQPGWGCAYAFSFLACFGATIWLFIHGYQTYMNSSAGGEILELDNLEKISQAFHLGTLGALQGVALLIYVASTAHVFVSRPRT